MHNNRIQPDQLTHTSAKHQAAENKNKVSRGQQFEEICGRTLLHMVVRCDSLSIVQKILARYADTSSNSV